MRTLVTGADGLIGAEAVRLLLAAGHEVTAVVRPGRPLRRLAHAAPIVQPVELADQAAVRALLERSAPQGIVHLAWYADPSDYLTSPENLASLEMTNHLLASALAMGCRKVVVAGTCLEYANLPRPRLEADPSAPTSLYASCKHAAWLVGRALAEGTDAALAWGRIFHLHGPGESDARLLPWVADQLGRGVAVDLTDGTQLRDHLHVEDAAAAFVALLESPDARGTFNVCSGEPVSLRRVLEIVGCVMGRPDLLRFGARPHRPDEVMILCGDSTRLRGLGWTPRWSFEAGLEDAVRRRAALRKGTMTK